MKERSIITSAFLLGAVLFSSSLLALTKSGSQTNPEPVAAVVTVTISNFQFAPKRVTVKVGSEVTWQVKEGTHTVNADNGAFESPTLSAGQTFTYKFTKAGTYRYYCSFHGSKGGHDMAGSVNVTK